GSPVTALLRSCVFPEGPIHFPATKLFRERMDIGFVLAVATVRIFDANIIDRPVGLCKFLTVPRRRREEGMALSPQEIAQRSADSMWARDDASKWLGARLDDVGPGTARMSMTIEKHHTNGHDICHGGYIFTLA